MKIDIHRYAYGNAAADARCATGPAVLKQALQKISNSSSFHWTPALKTNHIGQQKAALNDVATLCSSLANLVQQSITQNHFFITLGGDHSCAIGTWSGATQAMQARGDTGLIWLDAHMDAHTFETSSSKNIHGMPVAHLLGYGETELTHIVSSQKKIKPENLVLIGAHSFESNEETFLKKLNVKIFYRDDIAKIGLEKTIHMAIQHITKNTVCFGVSVDLDVIDPRDAPGVGTPAPNGVRAHDFLKYFPLIAQHPKLIGADIAEFNPAKDQGQKTEKIAVEIFNQMLLRS